MTVRFGRRLRAALLLRSLGIQGSWNYKTLIGAGFAVALLPALRVIYGRDPERLEAAVRRHGELFNSHPYLTPMALGAVARLEAEGADPAYIERFKTAIRAALGSLGDRLIWAGWRPLCLLGALALLALEAPWWLVVAAFLVVYNAGHLALRTWALAVGLREGRRVASRLRGRGPRFVERWVRAGAAFAAAFVVVPVISGMLIRGETTVAGTVVGGLAAIVGAAVGTRIRGVAVAALATAAVLGLLLTP